MIAASPNPQAFVPALRRSAISGFIFLAIALVLLFEAQATSGWPTEAVVWGGLALAAYAVGLIFLIGSGQGIDLGFARWKVGQWTLLWYGLVFGIATVTWSQPQAGTLGEIAVTSVLRALWLVSVGITAWALGYCVGFGQLGRRLAAKGMGALCRRFTADVRSPAAPWILYAIGVGARIINAVTSGRFGYVGDAASAVSAATSYGGVLGAVSFCAPLAVAAAALQVFRERLPGAWIRLASLCLIELVFGAASGGKQSFVIVALAVTIPYCSARSRLPKIALITLIFAFLVIVIPFTQAYRGAARQGSVTLTASQAVAAAPMIMRQTVTANSAVTVVPDSVDYLAHRICEISGPAIVVQRTPSQLRFRNPWQLIEGPVAGLVPRVLWSGKPIMVTGYVFSQEFYGVPPTVYTATADTVIGGLYWYGGWIPVIIGMFLLGCMVRLLDDAVDIRANPHGIFLVLLLFPSLVRAEYDWQSIITSIWTSMFVWLLAVALTFRPIRIRRRV